MKNDEVLGRDDLCFRKSQAIFGIQNNKLLVLILFPLFENDIRLIPLPSGKQTVCVDSLGVFLRSGRKQAIVREDLGQLPTASS